jgi:hypothetical protein
MGWLHGCFLVPHFVLFLMVPHFVLFFMVPHFVLFLMVLAVLIATFLNSTFLPSSK